MLFRSRIDFFQNNNEIAYYDPSSILNRLDTLDNSVNTLLTSNNDACFNNVDISGTLNVLGDVSVNNIDITGNTNAGNIIPLQNNVYSLGSTTNAWKDLYIGPGSLYVNGKKVIEDHSDTINIRTTENQNLRLLTSGVNGTLEFQTDAGGINFATTNNGNITFDPTGLLNIKSNIILYNSEINDNTNDYVYINDGLKISGAIYDNANNKGTNGQVLQSNGTTWNWATPITSMDISNAIAALVDSAPDTLNTLNELAAALGDDANFSTTITNQLSTINTTLNVTPGTVTASKAVVVDANKDISGFRNVNAANNITASAFYGDGSNLTGIDALPSQSGNSGKLLISDGTNATWSSDISVNNIDVSGNILTKGIIKFSVTNDVLVSEDPSGIIHRLDTLDNSVNTLDNKFNTLDNSVNILLTSNNDASFNNVDISGTLTVNRGDNGNDQITINNRFHMKRGNFAIDAYKSGTSINTFKLQGWVNDDLTAASGACYTTGNKTEFLKMNLYNTNISYLSAESKGYIWLTHNSNGNDLRLQCKTLVVNGANVTSDDRLKYNEEPINNPLSTIRKLNPQVYDKASELNDTINTNREAGFIAQEVYEIPELKDFVKPPETDPDIPIPYPYWILNYGPLFTYNIAATKELDSIVQTQQTEINTLKDENTLLKSKLNEILSEMGKQTI